MEVESQTGISNETDENFADSNEHQQDLQQTITAPRDGCHPLASLFPLMEGDDFAELVADIKANGLREPIVVDERGRILDGRNRMRACREAGVPSTRRTFQGDDDAILRFVISKNLHRRHLDTSQRAMIAAELAKIKPGDFAGNQHMPSANLQTPQLSQAGAAQLMNVSPCSVADAVKVRNEGDPELLEAVKQGKLTVSRAAKVAKQASEGQRQIPTGDKRKVRRKIAETKPKPKPQPLAQRAAVRATAHEASTNVRRHSCQVVESVRRIGEELVRAKSNLPDGSFSQWLQSALGWSVDDARRFIEVRNGLEDDDTEELGVIDLSVLHVAATLAGDQKLTASEALEPLTTE